MKMNKKYIAYSFMVVLALTIVSAAVVDYLSNTVSVDMSVESPLIMKVSDGSSGWVDSVSLGTIYGTETAVVYSQIKNRAKNPVDGEFTVTVSNDLDDVTLADFESITLNGNEVLVFCTQGTTKVKCAGTESLTAGETDEDNITITFVANVAPANYSIATQIMTA